MASRDLRLRLQRRREEEQVSKISNSISGAHIFGYVQDSEMPDWVRLKVAEWTRSDSSPDSQIEDEVEGRVNRWIEKFTNDSEIGKRFYCRTGLHFFPWLDCEVSGSDWVRGLRLAIGNDLVIVSHSKSAVVAFFQEEYDYLAFSGSQRA